MTNFLSRLITKTTETAPIVKPRPQSLYEPAARPPQMWPVETQESVGKDPVTRTPAVTDDNALDESIETPVVPPQKRAPTTELSPPPAVQDSVPTPDPEPTRRPRRSEEKAEKGDVTAPPTQSRSPAPEAQSLPPTPPTTPSLPQRGEESRPETEPTIPDREPPATKTVTEHKEAVKPAIHGLFVERVVAREKSTPPIEAATWPPGRATSPLRPQPTMPSSRVAPRRDRQPDDRPRDPSKSQRPEDNRPASARPPMEQDSSQNTSALPAMPSIPARQDGTRQAIPAPAMALYPQATVPVLTSSRRGADKRQSSEPEPTVRVHIGRIEVRATPPPAEPAKKPRRKTPVMSLDDYLERRNGRGKTG